MRRGGWRARGLTLLILLALSPAAFADLLSLADPPGDAVGDGSLASPTAERFSGAHDVRAVRVLDAETLTVQLELAGLAAQRDTNRVGQPIIEIYLDSAPGGEETLLPGSGMRLAQGGWEVAFQIAGEHLRVFAAGDAALTGTNGDGPTDVTTSLGARLVREGDLLTVRTRLETPTRFSLYGLAGSYDPFSTTGWRDIALSPSPWHFSSPTQTRPVIDVMADGPALQARAIRSGVLPEIRTSFQQERWLLIAALGALFALFGVALRLFASPPQPPEPAPSSGPAPREPTKPVISYGAREAGERAQILRSIDFETLQRGGWLEPVEQPFALSSTPEDDTREDDAHKGDPDRTDDETQPNLARPSTAQKRRGDAFQEFSDAGG